MCVWGGGVYKQHRHKHRSGWSWRVKELAVLRVCAVQKRIGVLSPEEFNIVIAEQLNAPNETCLKRFVGDREKDRQTDRQRQRERESNVTETNKTKTFVVKNVVT